MLYDKLKNYAESGVYPFHMPGHKRCDINGDGAFPYNMDLTEIDGFDNLHNPTGCIKLVEDRAAELYKVRHAHMLVNGATGGILAAVRSMTVSGDTVIVARNCHKSVYNAIELCSLNAEYVLPETDGEFGVFSSVTPNQIEDALIKNPSASLVILTSPTYEGVVSDISSIAKVCEKYGARLFVDEAHGAHFSFSENFPDEAVNCGAHAAVVSLHKTLPSLTQTALLLTDSDDLSQRFRLNLSVFETSSPSYILMASIEKCLEYVDKNQDLFKAYADNLFSFSEKCKALKKIKVLCKGNDCQKNHSFFDYDIGKIVISLKSCNLSGNAFAKILREKYNIGLEMSYADYAIGVTSVCDTKEGFDRLFNALYEIDSTGEYISSKADFVNKVLPQRSFGAFDRYKYKPVSVSLDNAQGKISLEYVWAYPPGIPLLVPGEIISSDTISAIKSLISADTQVFSDYGLLPKEIYTADSD